MSNCIEFVKGSDKVVFLKDEIDVVALKALVDSAAPKDKDGGKTPEERDRYFAWWFLQQNSIIDSRGAVIWFGRGNSTHTNRDFDGTLMLLAKFMKKAKYHTFFITDEGDGHRRVYREDTEFNSSIKINGKSLD